MLSSILYHIENKASVHVDRWLKIKDGELFRLIVRDAKYDLDFSPLTTLEKQNYLFSSLARRTPFLPGSCANLFPVYKFTMFCCTFYSHSPSDKCPFPSAIAINMFRIPQTFIPVHLTYSRSRTLASGRYVHGNYIYASYVLGEVGKSMISSSFEVLCWLIAWRFRCDARLWWLEDWLNREWIECVEVLSSTRQQRLVYGYYLSIRFVCGVWKVAKWGSGFVWVYCSCPIIH